MLNPTLRYNVKLNEAKDVLWEKLELPELQRTNSSKRPASEANVGDIDVMLCELVYFSQIDSICFKPCKEGANRAIYHLHVQMRRHTSIRHDNLSLNVVTV